MVAQKSLLKTGASVLALAGAVGSLRAKFNQKGIDKAKKSYEKNANIKKENNGIIAKKINPENTNESNIIHTTSPIVGEQPKKQKFILSEEGATFPIKAEDTKTNIPVDEDVQGLIKVKQKNARRAAAGKIGSNKYQKELETAKSLVGGKTDDVWNEIGLDPNITDEDIRKAGFTKTDIIKNFNSYVNEIDSWSEEINKTAANKGVDYVVGTLDDYIAAQQNNEFGRAWSAIILDKKNKEDMARQEEEANLKFWDNKEEEEYRVWLQEQENTAELSEEEKIEQGLVF